MASSSRQRQVIRVGYALKPDKIRSLIKPSFVHLAKERGIELIQIEPSKPLIEQGPFDCIVHKLFDPDWIRQLEILLSSRETNCAVFDPPKSIKPLHSRITMLEVVDRIAVSPPYSVGVPRQAFVEDPGRESIPDSMNFPIIVKPAASDGTPNSHEMHLVFGRDGFEKEASGVTPPYVLQEFVNHGGVVFKVYVAGRHVQCMMRRSLADIPEATRRSDASGKTVPFSQISNVKSRSRTNDGDGGIVNVARIENAELPPAGLITEVANGIRYGLKLNLFNFDLIRDTGQENRFLVIDINYFPGFSKLVNYERFLTDFFIDLVRYPTERWGSGNCKYMVNVKVK